MKNIITSSAIVAASLLASMAQAKDVAFYNNSQNNIDVVVYSKNIEMGSTPIASISLKPGQVVVHDLKTEDGFPVVGDVTVTLSDGSSKELFAKNYEGKKDQLCSADADGAYLSGSNEYIPGVVEFNYSYQSSSGFHLFDCDFSGAAWK